MVLRELDLRFYLLSKLVSQNIGQVSWAKVFHKTQATVLCLNHWVTPMDRVKGHIGLEHIVFSNRNIGCIDNTIDTWKVSRQTNVCFCMYGVSTAHTGMQIGIWMKTGSHFGSTVSICLSTLYQLCREHITSVCGHRSLCKKNTTNGHLAYKVKQVGIRFTLLQSGILNYVHYKALWD